MKTLFKFPITLKTIFVSITEMLNCMVANTILRFQFLLLLLPIILYDLRFLFILFFRLIMDKKFIFLWKTYSIIWKTSNFYYALNLRKSILFQTEIFR